MGADTIDRRVSRADGNNDHNCLCRPYTWEDLSVYQQSAQSEIHPKKSVGGKICRPQRVRNTAGVLRGDGIHK